MMGGGRGHVGGGCSDGFDQGCVVDHAPRRVISREGSTKRRRGGGVEGSWRERKEARSS